jgi:tetratricopeptide (TPR) repeat protein
VEDLIADGQAYADAYQLLGMARHMVEQREAALEAFDRALQLNERYVEAHIHRGLVLSEMGRSEEAAEAFDAARKASGEPLKGIPRHHASKLANHHAQLGEAYAEIGALGRAVDQYRAALELGPTFHDLRYRLARLLLESGRSLEAREELEAVVAAKPLFFEARAALGLACYVSGDTISAATIWEAMDEQYPNEVRVKAYLAMLKRGNKSSHD